MKTLNLPCYDDGNLMIYKNVFKIHLFQMLNCHTQRTVVFIRLSSKHRRDFREISGPL